MTNPTTDDLLAQCKDWREKANTTEMAEFVDAIAQQLLAGREAVRALEFYAGEWVGLHTEKTDTLIAYEPSDALVNDHGDKADAALTSAKEAGINV